MSTKKGKSVAGGKSTTAKSVASSDSPEQGQVPLTPVPTGIDPSFVLFPEWCDQDVNSEKWDVVRVKEKKKSISGRKSPHSSSRSSSLEPPSDLNFFDPQPVRLPPSIEVHEWKRPPEIFKEAKLVMYLETSIYPDMISGSKHLLHSDFMRSYISSVWTLEYLGNTHSPSPTESVTHSFSPVTENTPWRPWHHIYAISKAGHGQKHNPQVNEAGKYVVRLHWMGAWRKIIVDDRLPVDVMNHVLLPTAEYPIPPEPETAPDSAAPKSEATSAVAVSGKGGKRAAAPKSESPPDAATAKKGKKGGSKKASRDNKSTRSSEKAEKVEPTKVVELWPFILCKALLKLASLTWTETRELYDFNIVSCLTGWVVQKLDTKGLSTDDVWEMCAAYADHYAWEVEPPPEQPPDTPSTAKKSKSSKGKGSKRKKGKGFFEEDEDESGVTPCHVLATFSNLREMPEEELPDVAPCWSHTFLIDQIRDIPIIKPEPKPDIARWKRFRWLAWAVRNGLWPYDVTVMEPIKCLRLVSAFRKCADHVVYKPPSVESLDIAQSVDVIEELAKELEQKDDGKKKKGKKKGGEKKSGGKKSADKKSASSKSSKGSKKSKGTSKGKKEGAVALPPDPSIWSEFAALGRHIETLHIFMKPSRFRTFVKISDVAPTPASPFKGKSEKVGKKHKGGGDSGAQQDRRRFLQCGHSLLESRNEPIYLFADTLDCKFLVVNLVQVGNADVLKEIKPPVLPKKQHQQQKQDIQFRNRLDSEVSDVVNILKRIKSNRSSLMFVTEESLVVEVKDEPKKQRPFASLVLERYDWRSDATGDMIMFLNTHGEKTVLLELKKGRFVGKLWIKSDTPFVVNVMSDTPLVVGCLELVLESMAAEPHHMLKMCNEVACCYGRLVQTFGTPEHADALRAFYNSYKPAGCNLSKLQCQRIHERLIESLLYTLGHEIYRDDDGGQDVALYNKTVFALRVIFVDPNIPYKNLAKLVEIYVEKKPVSPAPTDNVSFDSEDLNLLKEIELSAVRIQAFFRRLYVAQLQGIHRQADKRYMGVFDTLRRVYAGVFSVNKRATLGVDVLRRLLFAEEDGAKLLDRYDVLGEDLQSTIHLQSFDGISLSASDAWIPICRYVFYCNSPKPVLAKISLFCDLGNYLVRVFNNDDGREMDRATNNVNVVAYENNAMGYTVLCYGWSDVPRKSLWKLTFATLKEKAESLLIVPEVTIVKDVVTDHYKPNVYNKVCRCLVSLRRSTQVTFRLSASYEKAKLHLRCSTMAGKIILEMKGKGNVIMPAIHLEGQDTTGVDNRSSSSRYGSKMSLLKKKSRSSSLTRTMSSQLTKKHLSERSSVKSSISSTKKLDKSHKRHHAKDDSLREETVYVVEGFVEENTWPLTYDEWVVVDEFKEKKLLGVDYPASALKSGGDRSALSKKSLEQSRRGTEKRSKLTIASKPWWCLHTLLNKGDHVTIVQDKTREEQIAEIKLKWYETDPGRYARSQAIRKSYLETHYIPPDELQADLFLRRTSSGSKRQVRKRSRDSHDSRSSKGSRSSSAEKAKKGALKRESSLHERSLKKMISYTGEDRHSSGSSRRLADERTLTKPPTIDKVLPPLDLEKYQVKILKSVDELDERRVKTPVDIICELEIRAKSMADFDDYVSAFNNDMEMYLHDQINNNNLLAFWYQGLRQESAEMIDEFYTLRKKFVAMLKEAEEEEPPPKKKKDKKNKVK